MPNSLLIDYIQICLLLLAIFIVKAISILFYFNSVLLLAFFLILEEPKCLFLLY